MPNWVFTGRTGQGKGLCSVGFMRDYIARKKTVATNMDIFPEHFRDKNNKDIYIVRLPDVPTVQDFIDLGLGNPEPEDEDENGLIMLDEAGTILNSRAWNEKGRKEMIDWIRHRRKYGWNMAFQIQGLNSLDTQIREDIIDYEVRCFKVNSLYIPIVSTFLKMYTGKAQVFFPKWMRWHTARFFNIGMEMVDSVHRYTGRDVHKLYDTKQVISKEYPHGAFCYLTPWHLVGRYQKKVSLFKLLRNGILYSALKLASCFDDLSKQYLDFYCR